MFLTIFSSRIKSLSSLSSLEGQFEAKMTHFFSELSGSVWFGKAHSGSLNCLLTSLFIGV